MSSPAPTSEIRTYELAFKDGGVARVDIPENYRVTFGPIAGAKGVVEGAGFAFRVWESETKQRLLFTRVESFRDVSIPMVVRAVRRFGGADDQWFLDDGTWTGKKGELVEHGWKPIDEVGEDPEGTKDELDALNPDKWAPPRARTTKPGFVRSR